MQVYKFDSKAMQMATYDGRHKRLTIQFTDKNSATYLDVPAHVFEELITADSAGKYFNSKIRPVYELK